MSLTPRGGPSSERSIQVPVEVDDAGFLRRECPRCGREFKWLPSDDSEPMPTGGYHCPYCDQQADGDQWFTKAQADYLGAAGMKEFAGPALDELERTFGRMNRRSSGMISISTRFKREPMPEPVKPHEPNDMRRVDFECHPKEPVKVLDDWTRAVHCLICGTSA
jgi:hypothetical protein